MKPTLKYGLIIGIACALWTYIMGFFGWYYDPALSNLFWIVILIEIVVLFFGLKQTMTEKNYWQQVGTGTLMAVLGSIIIFVASIIFTSVLFPNYFNEVREMNRQLFEQQGKTPEQVETLIQTMSSMQTPFFQALTGMLGTIFTGFVGSLILSAYYRKKD